MKSMYQSTQFSDGANRDLKATFQVVSATEYLGKTWIKRGVKTDNLVHIAHNVVVGEDTLLVAQVGISGSTVIGNHVTLAGQVGVVGHLEIGDNTMVGAKAGVSGSIPPNSIVSGSPHMPHRDWLKASRTIPKLPEMRIALKKMEDKVQQIETLLNALQAGEKRDCYQRNYGIHSAPLSISFN